MAIQIEKNIPLPSRGLGGTESPMGALRKLDVGDSVVFPRKYAMNGAHQQARYLGIKVAVRSVSATEARVWRVA